MRPPVSTLIVVFALVLPSTSYAQSTQKGGAAVRPAAARPAAAKASRTATPSDVDQIIELAKSGVAENLIVKTVQNSGKVYALAPADVLRLKKSGVSDGVIEAMLDTASRATGPSAPAAPSASAKPAASGSPNDREPTEKEMYAAIKGGADNANAFMKDQEAKCRGGGAGNDPALAMLCLAGALGTGGRGGIGVQVTGFRKIACAKALSVPGWNCDYVQSMDVSGIASTPLMKELTQNNVTHGRFLYVGDHWALMPD